MLRSPTFIVATLVTVAIADAWVVTAARSASEAAQLHTMIATYESPGDAMADGTDPEVRDAVNRAWRTYASAPAPFRQRMEQDHSPSGYWLQLAFATREAYRRSHPLLDQYLAYQTLQGGRGAPEDFLAQRR